MPSSWVDERGSGRPSRDGGQESKTSLVGRAWRALSRAGLGGDALLVIVKCVVAAGLSWYVAADLLRMSSPTFAPFSAVLVVHATVAESVSHSARYVLAMLGGVALAGVLSPLLGPGVSTFAALVLLALLLGQWRRLGSQGPQVAIAAMFAYQSMVMEPVWRASFVQLGEIAGLIVLGAVVGLAVNLLVVPPLRYRSAQSGVRSLARRVGGEFSDVADGLRGGVPSEDAAQEWSERVGQLPNLVAQTRRNLEHAAETLRFNPRRLLMRGSASFSGYRYTVRALSRAVDQLHALMRSLTFIAGGEADPDREQFLRSFADALDSVAGAARLFGDIHSVQDLQQEGNELQQCINNARSATREIGGYLSSERLEEPGGWPAYEALHADSRRLVEDIARAEHDLAQLG